MTSGTVRCVPRARGGEGRGTLRQTTAPSESESRRAPPRCGQDVDGGVQGPPVPVEDQAALVPPERGAGELEVAEAPWPRPALFAS